MFDPSHIPHVFRARSIRASRDVHATGYDRLDAILGGGWSQPALIELLTDVYGIGELHLMLPLLRTLAASSSRPPLVAWLNPPHLPNAVALQQSHLHAKHWVASGLSERDVLWAAEQCLRANACSAVLAWTTAASMTALRRLKLAASSTNSAGILFRPVRDAAQPSPATLRMVLQPKEQGLQVEVIKNAGRQPTTALIDIHARVQWSATT